MGIHLLPKTTRVTRVHATVRIAVRHNTLDGERWQTVELQAEAEISDPEWWREESRHLLGDLEQEVSQHLQTCLRSNKPKKPSSHDAFWKAVYRAGLSRDDGLRLLARANGDFARACCELEGCVN